MAASVIAFTFAALALVLMPGVDTILVLHTSIDEGRTAGIATAAGIVCGPIIWGFLAGIGAALIFAQSPVAFGVVAAAGGIYLLYLAYGSILPAVRTLHLASTPATQQVDVRHIGNHFGRGLVTDLLNPKIGIFYLAIMPSLFARNEINAWLGGFLGSIHAALGFVFLTLIAVLAAAARNRLTRPRTSAIIQLICGLCLAGFGVYALVDAVPNLILIQQFSFR